MRAIFSRRMQNTPRPTCPWHIPPSSDSNEYEGLRLLIREILPPEQANIAFPSSDGGFHQLAIEPPRSAIGNWPTSVLGVTQRPQDAKLEIIVKLSRHIPPLTVHYTLYYDVSSDNIVFHNPTGMLTKFISLETETLEKRSGNTTVLELGLWSMVIDSVVVLELAVLPREHPQIHGRAISHAPAVTQQSHQLQQGDAPDAMNDLQAGETLVVPGSRDCEPYQMTMIDHIASTRAAKVFKAYHSTLGECIVVKSFKAYPSGNDPHKIIHQSEMWLREYTSHCKAKDETIVELIGSDARHLALFQEYIPCQNLAMTRDSSQKFASDDCFCDGWLVLYGISRALSYTHEQGIQHNDIRPSNILFSRERGAVLCDFGLASSSSERSITTGGMHVYVPPEFLSIPQGRGQLGDVWALGIVMLYVLRLVVLPDLVIEWKIHEAQYHGTYARKRMNDWIDRVQEFREQLSEDIPIRRLVKQMLALLPSDRPESAVLQEDVLLDIPPVIREMIDKRRKGTTGYGGMETLSGDPGSQVSTDPITSSELRSLFEERKFQSAS